MDGIHLPISLLLQSEPDSNGWAAVKDDSLHLRKGGSESRMDVVLHGWRDQGHRASGSIEQKALRAAFKRLIADVKSQHCNSIEITRVTGKSFLSVPYVSVSAHPRHLQKGVCFFADGWTPIRSIRPHGSIQLEVNRIMNIRPLYDRIVVKRIEEQETTRNGIVIPDSAKEKPQEGEVMAVGHGKRLDDGKMVALDVKAGDRILFGKYSGNEIKLDGTEYIIMREDDVLGVLDAAAKPLRKPANSNPNHEETIHGKTDYL